MKKKTCKMESAFVLQQFMFEHFQELCDIFKNNDIFPSSVFLRFSKNQVDCYLNHMTYGERRELEEDIDELFIENGVSRTCISYHTLIYQDKVLNDLVFFGENDFEKRL